MQLKIFVFAFLVMVVGFSSTAQSTERFQLRHGDRVVLLGGTFLERMQSYGYLETLLTTAYPTRDITFRNLGWSGDTVRGEARAVFGSPADGFKRLVKDLTETKPTAILICYGENEAYAGKAGLEEFVAGLNQLLDSLQPTGARMALLSSRRHEKVDPPLPDPTTYNAKLQLYSAAIAKVAQRRQLPFIGFSDLLSGQRLTENGIHLTEDGYWRAAPEIASLLGAGQHHWSINIDAADNSYDAVGTMLDNVTVGKEGLRFTSTDRRLPRPAQPQQWRKLATRSEASPRLRFSSLAPGRYELLVDGRREVMLDHRAWGQGIVWHGGPSQAQAQQLRRTIFEKNVLYFYRYRPQNETYLFLFRKHEQGNNAVEIPQFDPLILQQEKRIAELRKPKQHHFELRRVK